MFLHLSVSHSVHMGVGNLHPGGLHPWGSASMGVYLLHNFRKLANVIGSISEVRTHYLIGGSASSEGLHPGSAFRGQTPPSDTTVYGQRAGGTHPTGMHSCLMSNLLYFDRSLIEFDWLSGQPLTLMDVYKKRFDWPPREYVNLNERTDVSRGHVFVTAASENHFP